MPIIRPALLLLILVFSRPVVAADFSRFAARGDDLTVTASKLLHDSLKRKPVVVWVGRLSDVSVYKNDDGATSIEWLCEQHAFNQMPKLPLTEPFVVRKGPSGFFVITLTFQTLSLQEARHQFVTPLKAHAWLLVRGEPQLIRKFKKNDAVFLHALAVALSNDINVQVAH